MNRSTFVLALVLQAVLLAAGCSDASILWGKACDPGEGCLRGYVCDPVTNRCVYPEDLDGGDHSGDAGLDGGYPDADASGDSSDQPADAPPDCSTTLFDDIRLNDESELVVVDPGAEVELGLEALLTQHADCTDCSAQLLFGLYAPAYWHQPIHCLDTGVLPPCPEAHHVQVWFAFTAPRTPGDYQVLAGRARDPGCARAMNDYLDWLGAEPFAVATVRVREPDCSPWQVYLTDVQLDGAATQAEVDPGTEISFAAEFFASQMSGCASCLDQIVVGIEDRAQICHDMRIIEGCPDGERGNISGTLVAPDASGVYQVRYGLYAHYDCEGAMHWYQDQTPGRGWTTGVVLVR